MPKSKQNGATHGYTYAVLSIEDANDATNEKKKKQQNTKLALKYNEALLTPKQKQHDKVGSLSYKPPTKDLPIIQKQQLPRILPAQTNVSDTFLSAGLNFPAAILNVADNLITSFLTPNRLNPSVDPSIQLTRSCTPVGETPPTPCPVIRGTIPKHLNGAYIRNGPNAAHIHAGDGCHLFDGDGMLHSVKLDKGKATYCARYVKTNRFRQEAAAGRPLFPKFFGGMSGLHGLARAAVTCARGMAGLVDVSDGTGLSNTSVGFFDGKVLSFSEDDMPYVIRVEDDGDLRTAGKYKLPWKSSMCAHPKMDCLTGEMYAFSFPPFTFFRVSADGVKSPEVPIPVSDMPLMHDFAITRNFVVFPESQLVLRPTGIINGEMPVACDSNKVARFCVLPRYGLPEDAIAKAQWFDAPGCNSMHYLNAWEEGNEIVIITPVLSPVEKVLDFPAVDTTCTLSEIRLNIETGEVRCRQLCYDIVEFGTVNQRYVGKKTRYGYLASGCFPELDGIVKVDFEQGRVVGRRDFGEQGYCCGEPFFVARDGGDVDEEDDGYLMCYVNDQQSGVSEFVIMDPRSPSLEIVAAVELPARVPVGFHGYFVTKHQLDSQR